MSLLKEYDRHLFTGQSGSYFIKDGINIGKWNLKEQIDLAEKIQSEPEKE